jgi:hypothetical protein
VLRGIRASLGEWRRGNHDGSTPKESDGLLGAVVQ